MVAASTSSRERLDVAVVERGLAQTRSRARALILAGDILVNQQTERRAGTMVRPADALSLRSRPRFVSRGGEKLDRALDEFSVEALGIVCADLGASTGGFTDCLLQRGATRVYAIDVGYGQIDSALRSDDRVVVLERVNARYLDSLPEAVDLVVIDVSFISLKLILPVAARLLGTRGRCIPLIKPQFEAGRRDVGKGGVVRDSAVHRRVLSDVAKFAESDSFHLMGLIRSPLLGPSGNVEFLADLRKEPSYGDQPTAESLIDAVLEAA